MCRILTLYLSINSSFSTEAMRHLMVISPLAVLLSDLYSLSISSRNFTGSAVLLTYLSLMRCTKGSLNSTPTSMMLFDSKPKFEAVLTIFSGSDWCFFSPSSGCYTTTARCFFISSSYLMMSSNFFSRSSMREVTQSISARSRITKEPS